MIVVNEDDIKSHGYRYLKYFGNKIKNFSQEQSQLFKTRYRHFQETANIAFYLTHNSLTSRSQHQVFFQLTLNSIFNSQ